MDIPSFDLKKPENIVIEVFDDDRWVKDKFSEFLASEILRFSETLAPSFSLFESLNQQAKTVQASLVAGFIHGVLDCQTACKTFQISGVISVQKLPPWVV